MAGKGLRVVPVRCRERSRARQSSAKAQTKRRRYPGISERNRSKTRLRRGAHDSWRASASRQTIQAASDLFQKIVHLDPNHGSGWLNLGTALLHAKRYAESLAAFRQAVTLQPGSAIRYCNMSLALMNLGCLEEAIDVCRKAIVIDPGSPAATFNLGTMLLALGNFREGWQAYNYRYAKDGRKMVARRGPRCALDRRRLGGQVDPDFGGARERRPNPIRAYLPALHNLGALVCVSPRKGWIDCSVRLAVPQHFYSCGTRKIVASISSAPS